ncbi:MAG: hypothetical protein ACRELB_06040 [Polyangiaceae bacterium]
MKRPPSQRLLLFASIAALAALAMMMWSLFDPRPLPVIGAMSIGQALGTLSFLLYLYVVARDLRRRLRPSRPGASDAPPPPSLPPTGDSA